MFQRNNPGEDIIYGLIDGRGSGFKVGLIKMWLKKHLSGQFIHYFYRTRVRSLAMLVTH